MTTTTQPAAALSAAALRAVLVAVEEKIARELHTAGRIEDAPAGALRLPEFHGRTVEGAGWLEVTTRAVTLAPGGDRSRPVRWTAPRAIVAVLEFRAEDPQAAHARDLRRAERLIEWWRYCYEQATSQLASCGPEHRFGDEPGAVILGRESYPPGCPLGHREMYSRALALAISAHQRLIAAGPAWPDQQSLF